VVEIKQNVKKKKIIKKRWLSNSTFINILVPAEGGRLPPITSVVTCKAALQVTTDVKASRGKPFAAYGKPFRVL